MKKKPLLNEEEKRLINIGIWNGKAKK